MSSSRGRPAVLFDRDGTLNVSPVDYLTRVEDLVALPGAFEAVGRLCRAGWPVAVCTNQSCIGLGIVAAETVGLIHEKCAQLAAAHDGHFDGFYVCPHRPEDGCSCRKPLPGLLLDAAREHGYDLARTYFVGDALRDLQAARAAGAIPLFVRTGVSGDSAAAETGALAFDDVAAATEWILAQSLRAAGT